MTARQTKIEPFPVLRASIWLGVAVAAPLAVVVVVLGAVAAWDQAAVAMGMAGLGLLAAIAGQAPVYWLSGRSIEGAGLGFVMGAMARVGLTLAMTVVFARWAGYPLEVTLGWGVAWYVWLLGVEVLLLTRYLRTRGVTWR